MTRKYSTTEKRIWQSNWFWLAVVLSFFHLTFYSWALVVEKTALKPSDFPDLSHTQLLLERTYILPDFKKMIIDANLEEAGYTRKPGCWNDKGQKWELCKDENSRSGVMFLVPNFKTQLAKADVVAMIAKKAYEAGIDPIKALQIAKAESGFDPLARNKHSSAKGVYQFLDKTFLNYCQGEVLNAGDNIDCFVKQFPKHPGWWLTARDY